MIYKIFLFLRHKVRSRPKSNRMSIIFLKNLKFLMVINGRNLEDLGILIRQLGYTLKIWVIMINRTEREGVSSISNLSWSLMLITGFKMISETSKGGCKRALMSLSRKSRAFRRVNRSKKINRNSIETKW